MRHQGILVQIQQYILRKLEHWILRDYNIHKRLEYRGVVTEIGQRFDAQ